MTDVERKRKTIINLVYYAMIGAIFVLFIKYAMGICFPLVFAFLIAAVLQRPKNFLKKHTFLKDGFASVVSVFLLIFVLVFLVALIGVRAFEEIKSFVEYIALQLQNYESLILTIENTTMNLISKLPNFLSETLTESAQTLFVQIREALAGQSTELTDTIGGSLSSGFSISWITTPLSGVISTAKLIPSFLIAIVITVVASCFMTADYDSIVNFIKIQFPEHKRNDLSRAKQILKSSLGKMGKAYLLIMLVTFIEMTLGLTVLRLLGIFQSNYIVVISIITAIVDIVPVLGTGTVLVPWAVYSLIVGDFAMAIGLAVIYGVITVIRQIVEPKLVAGQLGLSPVITIGAMYLGLKIFGVLGIIIAPLSIIMLKLLNDEGIIHLWKSPSHEPKEKEEQPKEKDEQPKEDTKAKESKPKEAK